MEIVKHYSHKGAMEILAAHHQNLLDEVKNTIEGIHAKDCLTKISNEPAKIKRWGGLIFSPERINAFFKQVLYPKGWAIFNSKTGKYAQPRLTFGEGEGRYREMDGVKNRVGLEIQFGKYAFMGYDIFSKMIIFKNQNVIDCGIEIVPVQEMVHCMSTGVSAFEHLMIDFQYRGEADIDIPVLVLGINATKAEWEQVSEVQQLFRADPETIIKLYPAIKVSRPKSN